MSMGGDTREGKGGDVQRREPTFQGGSFLEWQLRRPERRDSAGAGEYDLFASKIGKKRCESQG